MRGVQFNLLEGGKGAVCRSSGGHLLASRGARKQCHLLGRPEAPIPACPPLYLHLPYVELPLTFQAKNALATSSDLYILAIWSSAHAWGCWKSILGLRGVAQWQSIFKVPRRAWAPFLVCEKTKWESLQQNVPVWWTNRLGVILENSQESTPGMRFLKADRWSVPKASESEGVLLSKRIAKYILQKARDEGWEWHMSVMLPLWKQKQEDLELKTSLGYIVWPSASLYLAYTC